MRAYSLISVLAATVLLMVGLIPLLTLQGRLYRQARLATHDQLMQVLESDFQKVQVQAKPQSVQWQIPRYRIQRTIRRVSANRYQARYQVYLDKKSRLRWEVTREWYRR